VHKSQINLSPVDLLFEEEKVQEEQDRPYWNYEPPMREVKE